MPLIDLLDRWRTNRTVPGVYEDTTSYIQELALMRKRVNDIIAAHNAFSTQLSGFIAWVDAELEQHATEKLAGEIDAAIARGDFDAKINALWAPFEAAMDADLAAHQTSVTNTVNTSLANAQTANQTLVDSAIDSVDAAILALQNATAPTNIVPLIDSALKGIEGKKYRIVAGLIKRGTGASWEVDPATNINVTGVNVDGGVSIDYDNALACVAAFVIPNGSLGSEHRIQKVHGTAGSALVSIERMASTMCGEVFYNGTNFAMRYSGKYGNTQGLGIGTVLNSVPTGLHVNITHPNYESTPGTPRPSIINVARHNYASELVPQLIDVAGDHFSVGWENIATNIKANDYSTEMVARLERTFLPYTLTTDDLLALSSLNGFYFLAILEIA